MTRADAITKLRRIWGKRACGQVLEGISSPERREAAQEEHRRLAALMTEKAEHRRAVADAALAAAGVPALDAELRALREQSNSARADAWFYRFRAGYVDTVIGAFNVEAEGDTWEQVFERIEKKQSEGSIRRTP